MRKPVAERFMEKVVLIPESTCWYWIGSTIPQGYGYFSHNGKKRVAHRVSYELFVGPLDTQKQIDHLCRERGCVNPRHLEPVSAHENVHRSDRTIASIHSKKTHCPRGHQYNEENTHRNAKGGRRCRACDRIVHRKGYSHGSRQ